MISNDNNFIHISNLDKKEGIIIAFNKNEDHSINPYYLYNGLRNLHNNQRKRFYQYEIEGR